MIPEVNPYNNYRGDGVATKFDFDFEIKDGSQLIVEKIDENDVAVRLVENVDYEIVMIDDEIAGFINFPIEDSAYGVLQNNEILSLQLDLPFHQDSEYGQSSLLDLNSIEFSLDYLTRLCQILKRQMERSIKVKEGSDSTPDALLETINNNVFVSTNAANLASEKANEAKLSAENAQGYENSTRKNYDLFMEASTSAIDNLQKSKDNALASIEDEAEQYLDEFENQAKEIITEGEKQLNNVKSTGFYMRDDKLYFINSKGEEEEFKSGGGQYIGQTIFSLDPLFEDTLHLLDGALLQVGGIYDQFITDYISKLYTTNPKRFCTEQEYQTSLSTYGVCGKYVYTEGVSVRLPKVTGIVEGTLDANALGEIVEAGLPNIAGSITDAQFRMTANPQASGALSIGTASQAHAGGVTNNAGKDIRSITLDASASSSVYKNGCTTVQPQTIKGYYYIVVATGSKTDVEVNLDNIATDLNGKADVDLTNVSLTSSFASILNNIGIRTIIQTYKNGTSMYRIWSDGFCEQWGLAPTGASSVSLLKQYKDTNYYVNAHTITNDLGMTFHTIIGAKNINNFTIASGQYASSPKNLQYPANWYAAGYIS